MDDRATPWSRYAVELDGKEVRLEDFAYGFWDRVSKELAKLGDINYGTLLLAPLTYPDIAFDMAVEAARLLGNADPGGKIHELCVGAYGEISLKTLGDLFVVVDDDLPEEMRTADGADTAVPPVGDEQSTTT